MGKKAYEMAFRLNAKLGNSYNSTFANAQSIAERTVNKIAGTMAKIGAVVLGGMGISDAVNTYKDFQQSMANTGAIAGVAKTSKEFKALESAALEAGKKTTKTAQEAAEALGYMSLAGWSTEQSISGLMPVLRLSEATGADLATTSDLVTDSMSAMGLSVDQLSTYLDVAAQANNKSNQTATQLMEAIIGSGGAARAAGVDMHSLSTALGILADNGEKGAEAGTAMNSMLVRMTTNDKAAAAFEELGVKVFDSEKKFRGLEIILTDLDKAMEGMGEEDKLSYLKAIAGTNYFSQFEYLLDAVDEGTSKTGEFTTRWKELNSQLYDSEGALDTMAEAMNDTLSGALAILGSASDDFKIQIMKELEPSITPVIREIADALPDLGAKAAGFFKSAVRNGKQLWNWLQPAFKWVGNNLGMIKAGIVGLGGAFAAAKIADKIKNIKTVVKELTTAMSLNPLILFAEVIIGVGAAMYEAYRQAREADLAAHFGDIALSIDEIDDAAKHIVGKNNLEKLQKQLGKFEVLGEISEKMDTSLKEIERINWKISVGLELSIDEEEQYKQSINEYVENSYKYLEEAFMADYGLFEGNAEVQSAISAFYFGKREELQKLGEQLKEAVNKGFSDGLLKINPEEISNLQRQMAEIQAELAQSDYEAKMFALEVGAHEKAAMNGGRLDEETYAELMEKANEYSAELKQDSLEALGRGAWALENSFGKDTPEYKEEYAKIKEIYDNQIESGNRSVSQFGLNTIMSTYGKEITDASDMADAVFNAMASIMEKDMEGNYGKEARSLRYTEVHGFDEFSNMYYGNYGMNSASADNIKQLYNDIKPYVEAAIGSREDLKREAESYIENGKKVPETLIQDLKETEQIIKDYETLRKIGVIGDEYIGDAWRNVGKKISKNDYTHFNLNENGEFGEHSPMEYVREGFNEPVAIPVGLKMIPQLINPSSQIEKAKKTVEDNAKTSIQSTVPMKLLINWDEKSINKSANKAREGIKKDFEQPVGVNIPTSAEIRADIIDTSNFKNAVASSIIAAAAKGVLEAAQQANKIKLAGGTGINENKIKISPSWMNTPKAYARGTEYTPETFIAGEAGAELITGAKGRKVFTALETGNIFSNVGKIKDMLTSAIGSVNLFNKLKSYENLDILNGGENKGMSSEKIVQPLGSVNNNSAVTINIENKIEIKNSEGESNENLKALFKKALDESGEKIADMIRDIIEQNDVRKVRLSND